MYSRFLTWSVFVIFLFPKSLVMLSSILSLLCFDIRSVWFVALIRCVLACHELSASWVPFTLLSKSASLYCGYTGFTEGHVSYKARRVCQPFLATWLSYRTAMLLLLPETSQWNLTGRALNPMERKSMLSSSRSPHNGSNASFPAVSPETPPIRPYIQRWQKRIKKKRAKEILLLTTL